MMGRRDCLTGGACRKTAFECGLTATLMKPTALSAWRACTRPARLWMACSRAFKCICTRPHRHAHTQTRKRTHKHANAHTNTNTHTLKLVLRTITCASQSILVRPQFPTSLNKCRDQSHIVTPHTSQRRCNFGNGGNRSAESPGVTGRGS